MTNPTITFTALAVPVSEAVVRFVEQPDGSFTAEMAGAVTARDERMVRFMTRRLNKISQAMDNAIRLLDVVENDLEYVTAKMGPDFILDILEIQEAMNIAVDMMNDVFFYNDKGFTLVDQVNDLFDTHMRAYIVFFEAFEDLQVLVASL